MEMPGRTRGETRAMRDAPREYAHRHGLSLDHAALVSMLEKGETVQEVVHEHGASPDLPTARASDLHTPASVSEVETARGDMETLDGQGVPRSSAGRHFRAYIAASG